MIPQGRFDVRRVDQLRWWLIQEITREKQDRQLLEEDWIRWSQAYRARPVEDEQTFPFIGASNLVIPVIGTDVDVMFARIMGMLFETDGLWSIEALRPELTEVAPKIEEFLDWAQKNEIDMVTPIGDWLLDILKLGTGVLKQRYHREMKKVFEWRELDNQIWQQQALIMLKDAPRVDHVKLHNFFIPAGFADIQAAPWVAERVMLTWTQYIHRVHQGIYLNPPFLREFYARSLGGEVQEKLDDISRHKPGMGRLLDLYEFWLDFDVDGDGYDEAIVCTIHLDSQSVVRLDFNPFFNQDKPYSVGRYMRDGNSFYGIGLAEMGDHFQEEITAMHNQRIDNGTVQNSQTFAVAKDNTNISADEPVYPAKIWRVNNPRADIVPIALGSTSVPASIETENATLQYHTQRTGVSDYITGTNSPDIGYGAAYTTQQMMAQATKRFGEFEREIRGGLAETGTRVLELYQQYNQRGKPFIALGQDDGALVNVVLHFPLDLIRKGLRVNVTAIDAEATKEARVRTNTIIMQQLMGFYQQYMTALQYVMNPQLPPQIKQIAVQMVQGMSLMMHRILDDYNIQDADRFIPELQSAQQIHQAQLAQLAALVTGGQPPVGGVNPALARPGAASGVAALPTGAEPTGAVGMGSPPDVYGPSGPPPGPGGVGYAGQGFGVSGQPAYT